MKVELSTNFYVLKNENLYMYLQISRTLSFLISIYLFFRYPQKGLLTFEIRSSILLSALSFLLPVLSCITLNSKILAMHGFVFCQVMIWLVTYCFFISNKLSMSLGCRKDAISKYTFIKFSSENSLMISLSNIWFRNSHTRIGYRGS